MKFVEFVRPWNTLPMNALQFQLLKRCFMIKQMLWTWWKKSYPSPYLETHNSGWRNHPNFSWRNDNVVAPPTHGSSNFVPYNPPPNKSLEDTLQQFMQTQSTINNQTSQVINDIRSTLSKLTTSMSIIEKGKFPSQPQPNPQGQFCVDNCSFSENKVS